MDISGHRARPIGGEDLSTSDLVLGFERIHIASAVVDAQAPRERSFTLPELVELLGEADPPETADPIERARLALRSAHEHRHSRPPDEVLLEVADPWNRPTAVYTETATKLARLCEDLVPALFGRSPATG